MTNFQKYEQELTNPCLKEQNLSYKCFDQNNYDKSKCELETDNYNLCKHFWSQVRADRRSKGIRPYLPPPEERERIKKEFFEKARNVTK